MNAAGRGRRGQPSSGAAGTLDPGGSAATAAPGTADDDPVAPAQASGQPDLDARPRTDDAGPQTEEAGAQTGDPRAQAGQGRFRAIARRPAARHLALLAIYVAAGIAVTWPRAAYLPEGKLPVSSDVSSYVWDLWWVARQVTHLSNPWFTNHMAAPAGIQLGFDTTMPLAGLLMTPITLAFGPSASFSLLTIVTPGLLCYVMYRAARLWLAPVGAIAAGALFGLASMLIWQNWYHVNIAIGTLFLPLTLEAAVRLRRAPSKRLGLILGLILGASVLVNQESAVLAAILAALILGPWLVSALARDRATLRAGIVPLALGALVAVVVAAPQLIEMALQVRAGGATAGPATTGPALLTKTYGMYGADLPALFGPSPRLASYGLNGIAAQYHYQAPTEGMPAFGLVLGLLALLGLVAGWRRLSAWWLALLWLGGAALALGTTVLVGQPLIGKHGVRCPALTCHQYVPLATTWNGVRVSQLMPYTWLVRIPGLSALREADRLALIGLVGAALLAGFAVDWISRHARPLLVAVPLLAAMLVLAALEAGWSGTPGPGTMPTARPALDRPIAADPSGSVVLDVPFGLRGGIPLYGSRIATPALLIATADGHPRAVSYTSWVPAPTIAAFSKQAFFRRLNAAERGHHSTTAQRIAAQRSLRRLHIGWVLVWLHIWKTRQPASRYQNVEAYLEHVGFRRAYQADGVIVFRPAPK